VPAADLASLAHYRERTPHEGFRHGAITGMIAGLFVGAAAGAGLYAVGVLDHTGDPPSQIVTSTTTWSVIGLGLGGLGGGFIGGASPGAGWAVLALPSR
jgi:hypothetical protein